MTITEDLIRQLQEREQWGEDLPVDQVADLLCAAASRALSEAGVSHRAFADGYPASFHLVFVNGQRLVVSVFDSVARLPELVREGDGLDAAQYARQWQIERAAFVAACERAEYALRQDRVWPDLETHRREYDATMLELRRVLGKESEAGP